MIDLNGNGVEERAEPKTSLDLYLTLLPYYNRILRVRHASVERTGMLTYLSYQRERKLTFYELGGPQSREIVNCNQHVEVLQDGSWIVICQGSRANWSLGD